MRAYTLLALRLPFSWFWSLKGDTCFDYDGLGASIMTPCLSVLLHVVTES